MSSRYAVGGKRKSSMVHATRTWTCLCGKKVTGNGGKAGHRRACKVWAEDKLPRVEAMLADPSMRAIWPKLERERDQFRECLGLEQS